MEIKGLNIEGIVKIDNARLYGLIESIKASGYPMSTEHEEIEGFELSDSDIKRATHLGSAIPGSGHDCYLKGTIVQFDLQAPEYIWRQLDRYHFIDYVSSQSKMHRIVKMNLDDICNKYVSQDTIEEIKKLIEQYNNFEWHLEQRMRNQPIGFQPKIRLRNGEEIDYTKENLFKMIIANCPCGLMLTARMTTNYLQVKSIVNQRTNHKMQEWHYITDWFKELPLFKELTER